LRNAQATELARLLQSLFAGSPRSPAVRIVADQATNALIVAAPGTEVGKVKELVAKLDTPRAEGDAARLRLQVFPLRALEADQALENALRLALPHRGSFALDRPRRQVIVNAPDETMRVVEALLVRLDQQAQRPPAQDVQVRVV